ncbi:MAG: response regulator [Proteobacteria bacterium]|nr:response regulator [Pseudomonadota bacterium]
MAKILVVDDDESIRWVLAQLVEHIGHAAFKCRDGQRALDALMDNPDIELIITDVSMPGMDGRTLIRKVRALEDFKRLPIIIISGVVGPREIADVLDLGATAFLAKPVSAGDLNEYIKRYIDPSSQSAHA